MTQTAPLIRRPEEITGTWLAGVLDRGPLELHAVERIGTGQMSQCHRATFSAAGDAPETVVVKLASDDDTSRATGVGMGAYLREVRFYQELAPSYAEPVARCHLAVHDEAEGWFTLVLDEVQGGVQGDQVTGCDLPQAQAAIDALAALHAPVLGDLATGAQGWLNQPNPLTQVLHAAVLPGFLERYGDRIAAEHREVAERFVLAHDAWLADERPPLGLVHGDFRLDNLLFAPGGVTVVDFQTISWGPAVRDLSYFIGTGLQPELRRAHEEDLVRRYHEGLLARGAHSLDWDTTWFEYRRQVFLALLMTTIPAMVVGRTERGDEMFVTLVARVAQQALDLGALDLLPDPAQAKREHLRPDPADEGRHAPGTEPTWNESWYFDAVADDGSVGAYVRLGRLPNQGIALYAACVCGPGRPTVMLLDGEAPLARWRVEVEGRGASFADPAAILRGAAGEPVDVALDLVWETAGEPYRWRLGERYEIPCRVTGTLRVGDEELELAGPGQRDHSWGSRDWWGADWVWSALHLDDGTHTHLVTTPGFPGRGSGPAHRAGAVDEGAAAARAAAVDGSGLVTGGRLEHGADLGPALAVQPTGYGPILLEAPDGRVTHFVRAMVAVRAADGRHGRGWVEWNRNQPRPA